MIEGLWDVHEAAAYFKMSVSWVYRHVAARTIPHIKFSAGAVRFDPASLREWALTFSVPTTGPDTITNPDGSLSER